MRKRILTTLALLAAPLAFASIVVLFNPTTKQLVQIIPSADTLQYLGRSDALINPVIPTNTWDWLYVTNGAITNWTLSQYLAISNANWLIASNAAYVTFTNYLANLKTGTITTIDATNDLTGRIIRAVAEIMMDGHNEQTAAISNLAVAITGASSFANSQTRVGLSQGQLLHYPAVEGWNHEPSG